MFPAATEFQLYYVHSDTYEVVQNRKKVWSSSTRITERRSIIEPVDLPLMQVYT